MERWKKEKRQVTRKRVETKMMVIFSFMSDNNETTSTTRPLSVFFFRAAAAISFPVDFSSSYSIIWNTPNTHKRNVGLFTSIVLYYVRSVFHSWIQSFEIIENKDPTVRLRKRHSLFFFFFFFFLLSSFPTVFYVSCDINSVLKWKKKKPSDPWCLGRFFFFFIFHARPSLSLPDKKWPNL